jgi:rubrerythrin
MMTEADILVETQDLLRQIVKHPEIEIEWIDLLSQLEYVGCRKILKSVPYKAVTAEILQHVVEEASHALLLKNIVDRSTRSKRSWAEAFFSDVGWQYFQDLDTSITRECAHDEWHYPAVSLAVEQRVLVLYPCYLEMTQRADLQTALRQILRQERTHKERFDAFPFTETLRTKLRAIEQRLWTRFVKAVSPLIESAVD